MKIQSKNHQSQLFARQHPNRKQTSGKHRNDHSIQTKSPLKISNSNNNLANKTDLTFRIKSQSQQPIFKVFQQQNKAFFSQIKTKQNQREITNGSLFNKSIKINLKALTQTINLERLTPKQKVLITDTQCSLIDKLWEICTKLCTYKNQYIQQNLYAIQFQIKKMLCIIAEQNLLEDSPLSSSKKIKLQNCMAHSHCEKSIDHKEFESDQEFPEPVSPELQDCSQGSLNTIKTQILSQQKTQNKSKKSQNNDQLQMKKIMYMLDHKNVQSCHKSSQKSSKYNSRLRYHGNASDRVKSQKYQQLSSFNQNSCDDSGYTVYQIQRCTQRLTEGSSPKKSQSTNYQTKEISKPNFYKKNEQKWIIQQNQHKNEIKIQNQTYQTCSESQQSNDNQTNFTIGNKRKVLNDIVAMLNHKYNKNIRLE